MAISNIVLAIKSLLAFEEPLLPSCANGACSRIPAAHSILYVMPTRRALSAYCMRPSACGSRDGKRETTLSKSPERLLNSWISGCMLFCDGPAAHSKWVCDDVRHVKENNGLALHLRVNTATRSHRTAALASSALSEIPRSGVRTLLRKLSIVFAVSACCGRAP